MREVCVENPLVCNVFGEGFENVWVGDLDVAENQHRVGSFEGLAHPLCAVRL